VVLLDSVVVHQRLLILVDSSWLLRTHLLDVPLSTWILTGNICCAASFANYGSRCVSGNSETKEIKQKQKRILDQRQKEKRQKKALLQKNKYVLI